MSEKYEDVAIEIRKALQDTAPKGTQFFVLYILPEDDHVSMATNMTDKTAVEVLVDAIDSIKNSPPIEMPDEIINQNDLN